MQLRSCSHLSLLGQQFLFNLCPDALTFMLPNEQEVCTELLDRFRAPAFLQPVEVFVVLEGCRCLVEQYLGAEMSPAEVN